MAQPATNPKIEELRFRLKSDPKSRLFYPLAEELRKISQYGEAEHVLRGGLGNHPSYLSAWVSLGRVLRDQHKENEAIEALTKALQLDPGNVVAARLLADAYLALGDKLEALKKYKLVYALFPGDQELEGKIARLEAEVDAPPIIPEPDGAPPVLEQPMAEMTPMPAPPSEESDRVFDETGSSILKRQQFELATGDAEPMSAAHAESPFEEAGVIEGYGTDAFSIEQPEGMHIARAPLTAELPIEGEAPPQAEPTASADEADVFAPSAPEIGPGFVTPDYAVTSSLAPLDEADFARTIRMADLFAAEGSINEARDIYEDLLARDPQNAQIRAKLDALRPAAQGAEPEASPANKEKVAKLESWLARVKRGEVGRV
ncbi:MAG TPA: tetratricopeptide repeat protein [Thermoanaerobaculia bacterium]|nr:tetratricopeptide repeat protein [Thermoanaerobaculia bacterium]